MAVDSTKRDAVSAPEYEFDERQNRIIDGLAERMRLTAWPLAAMGCLYALVFAVAILQAIRDSAMIGNAAAVGVASRATCMAFGKPSP